MTKRPPRTPCWLHEPRARPLLQFGGLLIISGLVHLGLWAVWGGPWEGPVIWRKPVLFGLSGGLTSISLGWVWSQLPWRRGDRTLASVTAWALAIEVALIDLQRWRGVASHFNRDTLFDSILYDAMGGLILLVTVVAADLTLRLLRGPTRLEPAMQTAAVTGMILLVVSCGLGIWASVHGDLQAARGLPPELVARAGVTKFPHGIAIHAIQWLPLLAWAMRRAGVPTALRGWLVWGAATGWTLVLAYALAQTLAGRSRFDAPPAVAAMLVGGACLLVAGWLAVAFYGIRLARSSMMGRTRAV